jgi:hypothetical protein
MASPLIDIVTVVFAGELPLLDLQARSFARFLPPGLVGRIRVVINDPDEATACRAHIEAVTRPLLGPLARRLTIYDASVPSEPGPEGWKTQQAAKLEIARAVRAPHYLILDAKHHLVRTLDRADLFLGRKARMPFARPIRGSRQWLVDSRAFFGLATPIRVRVPPSIPPFCVRTSIAVALVGEIEQRSGRSIGDFFATKTDQSTEFMLYFAYLGFLGKAKTLVSSKTTRQPTMRRRSPPPGKSAAYFAELRHTDPWVLAIHRRRFLDLGVDHGTRAEIVGFWVERGLFDSLAAAEAEMARLIAFYAERRGSIEMRNRVQLVAAAAEAADTPDEEAPDAPSLWRRMLPNLRLFAATWMIGFVLAILFIA